MDSDEPVGQPFVWRSDISCAHTASEVSAARQGVVSLCETCLLESLCGYAGHGGRAERGPAGSFEVGADRTRRRGNRFDVRLQLQWSERKRRTIAPTSYPSCLLRPGGAGPGVAPMRLDSPVRRDCTAPKFTSPQPADSLCLVHRPTLLAMTAAALRHTVIASTSAARARPVAAVARTVAASGKRTFATTPARSAFAYAAARPRTVLSSTAGAWQLAGESLRARGRESGPLRAPAD